MNAEQATECARRALDRLSAACGISEENAEVWATHDQVALAFAGTGLPGPETLAFLQNATHVKMHRMVEAAAASGGVLDLESEMRAATLEALLIGVEMGREAQREEAGREAG